MCETTTVEVTVYIYIYSIDQSLFLELCDLSPSASEEPGMCAENPDCQVTHKT